MTQKHDPTNARKIIRAAIEEFSLRGKNGARVADIAERAGLNKAMIYYYYRSKDQLYEEVFKSIIQDIVPIVMSAFLSTESFIGKITNLVNSYVNYVAQHRTNVRLVMRELAAGGPVFVKVIGEQLKWHGVDMPTVLIERIRGYMEQGEIRPMDPRQVIISFIGLCVLYFGGQPLFKALLDTPEDDSAFIEERKASIVDLFLHGVRGGADAATQAQSAQGDS